MPEASPSKLKPVVPEAERVTPTQPPAEATGQPPQLQDELADFFDIKAEEIAKPEQILADVLEAKKDGFARKNEVHQAVADPENPHTKQGRELGGVLVEGLTAEVEPARVSLVLGEKTAERLQAAETADVSAVIKELGSELRVFDGGSRDIFRNLPDEEATAAIGAQRRTEQQRVTVLKATLLGISETSFGNGDLEHGLDALLAARIDMFSAEPKWLVRSIAEAVIKADLEKPEVRAQLIRIVESRVLSITSDVEAKIVATPVAELSGQEAIYKKGLEARAINQKIEAEARETKLKAEYEERMKTAQEVKMTQAVADGKSSFKEHFEGGNSWIARFKEYGGGSSMLVELTKDWQASSEVTNNHRLGGVVGYLQVLENIQETPGFMDKSVAILSERYYSDAGGKSKTEYEREGRMGDWNAYIRSQILTEIHGNALGILQGAIEYEGQRMTMTDQTRIQILSKSLEVLGGGRALEGLIAGKGELTPEQQLARKALLEYIKNPIAGQERLAEQVSGLAERRLARLKSLKDMAPQADIGVAQRREEVKKQARLKLEEEERRRGELRDKVGKSQEHLRVIDGTKEKIHDTKAKGARIEQLTNEANLEDYLTIDRRDKDQPPRINISVNAAREKQVRDEVKRLKEALDKDPHNRQLRDQLAVAEVDAKFLQNLRDLASRVDNPDYKRTFTETGVFKKPKGTISVNAFDAIADPGPDVGWNHEAEVTRALQGIEEPVVRDREPKKKSLAQLHQETETQAKTDNLQEIAQEINWTTQALSDRAAEAKKQEIALAQRAEKAIAGLARYVVKYNLETQLRSERRLSYT